MKSIKELNEEKKIMLDKSEMLSSMRGGMRRAELI